MIMAISDCLVPIINNVGCGINHERCCGGRVFDFDISRNDGVRVNKLMTQNSTAFTLSLKFVGEKTLPAFRLDFLFFGLLGELQFTYLGSTGYPMDALRI